MTYAALGFHRTLTEKEGYQGTEEAYYTEVDRRMKDAFPHKYNGAAQPGQTRPAQSVAPATRKQKSGRSTSVRLSSSERDIAKRLGISEKQYAAQKLKLEEQRV
jgi:phage I-like protein